MPSKNTVLSSKKKEIFKPEFFSQLSNKKGNIVCVLRDANNNICISLKDGDRKWKNTLMTEDAGFALLSCLASILNNNPKKKIVMPYSSVHRYEKEPKNGKNKKQ